MAQELTSNVLVDGKWYGPDYPANTLTDDVRDKITNEGAFEPRDAGGFDLRTSRDDFEVTDDDALAPAVRSAGEELARAASDPAAIDDGVDDLDKDALRSRLDVAGVQYAGNASESKLRDAWRAELGRQSAPATPTPTTTE